MGALYSLLVVYVLPLGIVSFILFFVMKAAVNSVLEEKEIQEKKKNAIKSWDTLEGELIALRDIELLSDAELEEAIGLFKAERADKESSAQYRSYLKILNELKEREYFTGEQYAEKSNKLKKHFHID